MNGWRTVDIVVCAAIGVAFGVVFWAWGLAWAPLFSGVPNPAVYLLSGVWLIPAVLGPLVVRQPGAALLAETMAAVVSAFLGSTWGLDTIVSGLMQGAGAELVFAIGLYRSWGLIMAGLAGAGAAFGEWLHDMTVYFPNIAFGVQLAYGAWMLASGMLVAGLGSWFLLRAMLPTGVLDPFPSGRSRSAV